MKNINELAQQLAAEIAKLSGDEQIDEQIAALNQSRYELSKISPFKGEPIDYVRWVKSGKVVANDYNPNSVARPEMKLLEHSIRKNGFAMPIIAAEMSSDGEIGDRPQKVVDGFHRHKVGKGAKDLADRMHGYLPVVNIAGNTSDPAHLMSATVEFNRARGEHSIELMAGLVKEMLLQGQTDQDVAKHLGMEAEEVLRLKQMTGLAGLFADQPYSKAWESIS